MNNEEVIMSLIVNAGNSKSSSMEAIRFSKENNFEEAAKKIEESKEFLNIAHNAQTGLLVEEANGNHIELGLLMVHAQDHLMNAITVLDLSKEIVDIHKKISKE